MRIRRKIEGIEGNLAGIVLAKFFACHRGFDRVSAGCRARDRVGPKGGRR